MPEYFHRKYPTSPNIEQTKQNFFSRAIQQQNINVSPKNMLTLFKIDFENKTSFIGILQDNNVVKFLGAPMITKLIYFFVFAKPPVI